MRQIAFAAALMIVTMITPRSQAQQAVYLLRHAERLPGGQDGLTDEGKEHAKALVRLMRNAKIKAIYTSEFERTKQTAKPLADSLGLTIIPLPHDQPGHTFNAIRADHPHDVVLVVGHSGSVPAMIKLWDPSLIVSIDEATEFDRLFFLVPAGTNQAGLGRFRYRKDD